VKEDAAANAERRFKVGMSKCIPLAAIVAAVIGALLIPAGVRAADGEIPSAVVEEGHDAYLNLCASCHGDSGKGDGPLAVELVDKPTDLTLIARKNDGKFPFWQVYQTINGRRIPRAHGKPEMPVWGRRPEMFYGGIAPGETAHEWMLAVTFYLQSIQEK
jgi:mono/diheme cytochrome c family protein